jgi:hypothetical protein
MEGPQSDKDVQLYKEMAADVGNDALPRGQRLSALKVMRELYGKYEHLNRDGAATSPQSSASSGPAKIASDADYHALPSGTVFIGPDGKQRKKP